MITVIIGVCLCVYEMYVECNCIITRPCPGIHLCGDSIVPELPACTIQEKKFYTKKYNISSAYKICIWLFLVVLQLVRTYIMDHSQIIRHDSSHASIFSSLLGILMVHSMTLIVYECFCLPINSINLTLGRSIASSILIALVPQEVCPVANSSIGAQSPSLSSRQQRRHIERGTYIMYWPFCSDIMCCSFGKDEVCLSWNIETFLVIPCVVDLCNETYIPIPTRKF